ncbi:MAG: type VI secretion system-associated protein TagF, partial [Acetobacteraceae bacterium]|nr:type VI secretion system-associated protein TagF [Acetobacteraceae bacterium]
DFLSRGLPASFADPWHAWLVRGIAAARQELAERFEPAYMAAPVWRFVLPPGACGPSPAAGVVLPSVDAVGRLFPLTLAVASPSLGPPLALAAALPWFQALEEAGRDALASDPEVEAWLARLAAIPPPAAAAQPPRCAHVPLQGDAAAPDAAVQPALAGLGAERAVLFWCEGSPFVGACALVAPGLPDGVCFSRLLSDPVPPPAPLESAS